MRNKNTHQLGIGDQVKVWTIDPDSGSKKLCKMGRIVKLNDSGAHVWDAKDPYDRVDCAEWFPFEAKCSSITLVSKCRKQQIDLSKLYHK